MPWWEIVYKSANCAYSTIRKMRLGQQQQSKENPSLINNGILEPIFSTGTLTNAVSERFSTDMFAWFGQSNPFPHKVKLHQTISLGKTSLKMLFWYLRPRFNMNLQNSKHWKVSAMIVLLRNINKAQRHLAANFPTLKQKSAQLSLLRFAIFPNLLCHKSKSLRSQWSL